MARAVVIDNDLETHAVIKHLLGPEHSVLSYHRGTLAVDFISRHSPDVVFLSMQLTDVRAIDLLEDVCVRVAGPPVIALIRSTAPRDVAHAVRTGACDVVPTPIRANDLKAALLRALSLGVERAQRHDGGPIDEIVGTSQSVAALRRMIQKIGPCEAPVLVCGESGVGKELVARALHNVSPRRRGPFEVRNCGAIPESLFESEMFGTERGAFTGSVRRPGAFDLANRGTLFLDEIGELSSSSQVKLLRAVESKRYHRVGGTSEIDTDIRVLCATNRDLRAMTESGRFREDLFYRISVMRLDVPALRHRQDDLPLLVEHFHREYVRAGMHSPAQCFSSSALAALRSHQWPGNVRELRNVVMRALVMCSGPFVEPGDIQFD